MPFLPENLLEPISAESPCGEPASSQKNYEKLRDARKPNEAALEAFMAPRPEGTPRIMTRDMWAPREPNKLIEMLVDLPITKSKDLELAVWLSETLLWRHGLAGFHEGLLLVRGLLERYWDSLHPLPEEGDLYMRIRHLEWIGMTESSKDSSRRNPGQTLQEWFFRPPWPHCVCRRPIATAPHPPHWERRGRR